MIPGVHPSCYAGAKPETLIIRPPSPSTEAARLLEPILTLKPPKETDMEDPKKPEKPGDDADTQSGGTPPPPKPKPKP